MNLAAIEIKAFVPAQSISSFRNRSYLALGFEIPWASDDLAYVRYRDTSFLLQPFSAPEFVRNYQMHLLVESADDWHAHIITSGIAERFSIEIGHPEDRPWMMRDFTLLIRVAFCGE